MAFLFSPKARAFVDESLESYLLRVVAENFFDSYEQLSLAIREELHELDFDAHGAFPIDLKRLNVYHAKHNCHFRMRALGLLESLLGIPHYELQKLALLKSDRNFNSSAAVHRNGVDIPLSFIRYDGLDGKSSIPICPHCLADGAYIKQIWHIKLIDVCAIHDCELIHNCPECQLPINYIENESITHCSCGFELARSLISPAHKRDIELAQKLMDTESSDTNPLFYNTSISQRFAALFWYQKRYSKNDVICLNEAGEFFDNWPENFYGELDNLTKHADMKLVDLFNRTLFRFIYGEVILSLPYLNSYEKEPHFIRVVFMDYLSNLVEQHPKSKKPNVADMLISVSETARILDTSHEQVYRLYQDGILRSVFRQKMKQRINPHTGVFFLRQVIEYKSSFGRDKQRMYLSAW